MRNHRNDSLAAQLAIDKPCRESLVTQAGYVGGLAVRKGPWKLIPTPAKKAKTGPDLYHLVDYSSETKNLSSSESARVKELVELLEAVQKNERSRPGSR